VGRIFRTGIKIPRQDWDKTETEEAIKKICRTFGIKKEEFATEKKTGSYYRSAYWRLTGPKDKSAELTAFCMGLRAGKR